MPKRSAAEWRDKAKQRAEQQITPLPLPSGMVVDARRPPIADWIKRKQLPSSLMALAIESFGTDPTQSIQHMMKTKMKEGEVDELLSFVGKTVRATVISPKIVPSAMGVLESDAGKTLEELGIAEADLTFGAFVRGQGSKTVGEGDNATAVKLPPIVREFGEDEIGADEVSDEDTNFIFNWAMTGDGKGVPMGGGEVEPEDLRNFHPNDTLPNAGGDSTVLQGAAEPIAGG